MLNILPSPVLPRRRGGHLSNRNALKHGLHARRHPGPFTPLAHSVAASQPALFADSEVFNQVALALRLQIARLLEASQAATGLRSKLTWHRAVLHGITLLKQITKARQRVLQPQQHLQFIAVHALDLIRYDFRSSGITRDAYSFREKITKSDLNSLPTLPDAFPSPFDSSHSFLTPSQWQVLEPLLPSPHPEDGGSGRGWGRGRPPASPLPLLDAIFWKIARHARWQDLPAGSPPMLTCRRYYSRLYQSGRLLTIYIALYQDLLTHGQIDPVALVNQGCFSMEGCQLTLLPEKDETWQLRTSLLFLLQAHHISRRILREDARQHPRGFPHFHY